MQEAEACRALLLRSGMQACDELMWSMVHNNSKARYWPVAFLIYVISMMASKKFDYNVGLLRKASWQAHNTFHAATCLIVFGSSHISALMLAQSHQSSTVLMPVPYFSQSAAHIS